MIKKRRTGQVLRKKHKDPAGAPLRNPAQSRDLHQILRCRVLWPVGARPRDDGGLVCGIHSRGRRKCSREKGSWNGLRWPFHLSRQTARCDGHYTYIVFANWVLRSLVRIIDASRDDQIWLFLATILVNRVFHGRFHCSFMYINSIYQRHVPYSVNTEAK